MKHLIPAPRQQKGSMVIEALLAILLFSLGVIAMMGLQAASVTMATDARYRSDANLLANNLMAQMWASHVSTTLQADFQNGGAVYNAWLADVNAALPGSAANPPAVTIVPVTTTIGGQTITKYPVTVQIYWQSAGETTRHTYVAVANIY
jgi:type IV pilus assembly protein PilV